MTPQVHLPSVVARLGQTQFPDAYGGLTVRLTAAGTITMMIYVVDARAEPFLAAIGEQSACSPATQYTIVHIPHTWAELDALAGAIEGAKGQWRARGIHIGTAAPDAAVSKVIVTLRTYRPAAAATLTDAYGDAWISVVASRARSIPLERSPTAPAS